MTEEKQEQIYLFISQSCQHSRELIQQIQQKNDLAKLVQVVEVEKVPKLPPGLTKVPGILVGGKVKIGNECFDFVKNYGEIQTSPTFTTSGGFEADPYSYIEGEGGDTGGSNFSFLGASSGTDGIDVNQIDAAHQQEQSIKANNNSNNSAMNMDHLTQQRQQEISKLQKGY